MQKMQILRINVSLIMEVTNDALKNNYPKIKF